MIKDMDGDTFLCEDLFGEQWTIRLDGVDAPESNQPYGLDARNALRRMVLNHPLHIEWKQRDRYRRILGTVYAASRPPSSQTTNVNIELTSDVDARFATKSNMSSYQWTNTNMKCTRRASFLDILTSRLRPSRGGKSFAGVHAATRR